MNRLTSPCLSLCDILGEEYIAQILRSAELTGIDTDPKLAYKKVDFLPDSRIEQQKKLLAAVGSSVKEAWNDTEDGSPTASFKKADNRKAASVGGVGCMRVGEDGRLYLVGKSEHYHASLGHDFGGYKLISYAKSLGISNAAHNNSRGYITRLLERRLVETIGVPGLDRVINLETGSIACEAGIKMMLARFYALDNTFAEPVYSGKTPVFLVLKGNYHGTNVVSQILRGMWGGMYKKLEEAGIVKVVELVPNDIEEFKAKLTEYNSGSFKTAGFLHELIMMNNGAIKLDKEYIRTVYKLCAESDTPTLVDEIQTGMWYTGMFLFRLYGLKPDFVVIGKGFPGGEYPASRIVTNAKMDTLNQFGALVTNGQEELASLAYLITMEYHKANAVYIGKLGDHFNSSLKAIAGKYPALITCVEGMGHCSSLQFVNVEAAADCASRLNKRCIDCSVQLYKAECPPALLLKPPLVADTDVLDFITDAIDEVLKNL